MARTTFEQLLEMELTLATKHASGTLMAPPFGEKKGIHGVHLHKSIVKIDEAASAMKQIAKSGKKILFVSTKKQGQDRINSRTGNRNALRD